MTDEEVIKVIEGEDPVSWDELGEAYNEVRKRGLEDSLSEFSKLVLDSLILEGKIK